MYIIGQPTDNQNVESNSVLFDVAMFVSFWFLINSETQVAHSFTPQQILNKSRKQHNSAVRTGT